MNADQHTDAGEEGSNAEPTTDRRAVLKSAGIAVGAAAGCLSGTDDRGNPSPEPSTPTPTSLSGRIDIAGSSTVYPVTLDVGERFSTEHPEVTVSVTSTGTGGGFGDYFCEGLTSINDASRRISAEEERRCRENGVEPVEFKVATDALTVVVNPHADWASCVTIDELSAIWRAGGADRWSDVRPEWPAEPIEHYGPTPASGTYDYFSETVLGESQKLRTDYEGTEQDSSIVESVMGSRYAIGYFGFAYYNRNANSIRALEIDSGSDCVAPTFQTAKNGRYTPLSRPLYIYVARDALSTALVSEFVRFYLRSATTNRIKEIGYIPLGRDEADAGVRRVEDIAG